MNSFHGPDGDAALLAWWLDELPEAEADALEEHLFACDECAARLKSLLGLRHCRVGGIPGADPGIRPAPA